MTTIAHLNVAPDTADGVYAPERGEFQAHATHRIQTPATRRLHSMLALLLGAAMSIGGLEFTTRQTHSAISHTLSELFYAPGGAILFPTGAILLAAAIFVWSNQLRQKQMPGASLVTALGAIALVIAAMFPTDPTGALELSWSAQIHRYAAAGMFVSVPIAGLLQLRSTSTNAKLILAAATLSALAALPAIGGRLEALIAGRLQDVLHTFASTSGLVERIQLVLVLTIIAASTQALARGEGPTKRGGSTSISNNTKVTTMSTKTKQSNVTDRRPAGRASLFGYAWAIFLLAIPAWILIGLLIGATALAIVWIGVGLWGVLLVAVAGLSSVFRAIASHILGVEVSANYRAADAEAGRLGALRTYLTDPARWRDVAYLFFAVTAGFVVGLAALIAFLIFPIGYWVSPWLLRTWAGMTRTIIGPGDSEELKRRIGRLEQSRSETVDASAAELRRIERDLHDGAQARLVAVAIELGMAESAIETDPAGAVELVAGARESTQRALSELRDLVRGIHPPVLADRGLAGGLEALTLAHPGEVNLNMDLAQRFSAPVEAAAYFSVAEALTNAAKHAGAQSVTVSADYRDGELRITIEDDGTGGAHFRSGGGLEGLRKRLDAFDGHVSVISPEGGPTRVEMRIPCAPVSASSPDGSAPPPREPGQ